MKALEAIAGTGSFERLALSNDKTQKNVIVFKLSLKNMSPVTKFIFNICDVAHFCEVT